MKKLARYLVIPLAAVALIVVSRVLNPSRKAEGPKSPWQRPGASGADAEDPVVATVNGEAIRESAVLLNLPKGSFGIEAEQAREQKLDRMIEALELRQYLRKANVEVPASEIDREVADLRKNPPAAGCACCRYDSLEQFMQANSLDMNELRGLIANDLGLKKHLGAEWEREHPAASRSERIRDERGRVERSHFKVSHVFFKTFQNPAFEKDPDAARPGIRARAQAAWDRLQKGEAFDAVVKDVSEDAISRSSGGSLGCMGTYDFGRDFAEAVTPLKPGEVSKPFESAWGFHIVRREALTDDDVWDLLRSEWADTKHAEILNSVRMNAEVKR
jgi:hypothetical protein